MVAAALTLEAPAERQERVGRYSWPRAVLLHLAPGVLVMTGYLVLLPVARALELPPPLAFSVAVLLIGVPVQLGLLIRAGGALAFRRRLPTAQLAVVAGSCLAVALGIFALLMPVSGGLQRTLAEWLPAEWFLSGGPAVSRWTLVASLLVSLVVDGLVSPAVQEAYFRGYLMPRLPVAGPVAAPAVSAGLMAAQHVWQPQLILVVFAVQVVLGVAVWRTRCLAVAVVTHSACNVLAIGLTLLTVGYGSFHGGAS